MKLKQHLNNHSRKLPDFILNVTIMDIGAASLTAIPPSLGSCQHFYAGVHTLPAAACIHWQKVVPHLAPGIILSPGLCPLLGQGQEDDVLWADEAVHWSFLGSPRSIISPPKGIGGP